LLGPELALGNARGVVGQVLRHFVVLRRLEVFFFVVVVIHLLVLAFAFALVLARALRPLPFPVRPEPLDHFADDASPVYLVAAEDAAQVRETVLRMSLDELQEKTRVQPTQVLPISEFLIGFVRFWVHWRAVLVQTGLEIGIKLGVVWATLGISPLAIQIIYFRLIGEWSVRAVRFLLLVLFLRDVLHRTIRKAPSKPKCPRGRRCLSLSLVLLRFCFLLVRGWRSLLWDAAAKREGAWWAFGSTGG